ncbi:MAG: matrixin family metalloprotease [Actinomycetota bacterium]|nr:matrixin family metalloprotease [Actinomycetota bacterium]
MPLTVILEPPEQAVDPGSSVAFDVQVRNGGDSSETVNLSVTGPAGPFSWVAPDTLSVPAGGTARARVGFHMPAASLPAAGALPFRVTAAVDRGAQSESVAAAEGVVQLAPFSVLSVTLDPPEAGGTRAARQELCLSNRGNAPVAVRLESKGEGVEVRFAEPVVTVSPDEPTRSTIEVAPSRRLLTGSDRTLPFTVVATPAFGKQAEVGGRFVQQPRLAGRGLLRSGIVAGVVVIALVVAAGVFAGNSGSDKGEATGTSTAAEGARCPVEGHIDRFGVSGLSPDDIFQLPNTYSFFAVRSDGCHPVRFNPCEPVHYIQNAALAPPTGVADVQEAFRQLSAATGITFVDEGLTDETNRRRAYVPERYGQRWAPILVGWTRFEGQRSDDPAIQVVGRGIGQKVNDVLVSGVLSLNVDAVTDREAGTPLEGGFGPPLGSGVGSIGPKAVTWGRVILHELAHVVGLGHTRDKGAIMYPETADQTARPAEYKEPDLAGLRLLGREAGCLETPPVPPS